MKLHRLLIFLTIASLCLIITACGGDGGGPVGYGEVKVHITDAKPLLPEGAENITNLFITFTGISVHKSGDGWISLPLAKGPSHTIDLLQFINSNTTEIVPPLLLEYGKYTQTRLIIESASIRFDNDPATDSPVIIPPAHLKTVENFIFDVNEPVPIDIIIDFDLSQSLIVTDDGSGTFSYKLKPVLHIVDALETATISGEIDQGSFIVGQNAQMTVYVPNPDFPGVYKEYTKMEVSDSGTDPTEFSIYWLDPDQVYSVEIDFDPDSDNGFEFSEDVSANDLEPGEVWNLGGGTPI
ncbi:MAG TPA: DUF4382 domain-containing protein [Bacteroidales bacterium]|nr:DUF4382 domain-containing protein [Bacteroidales bacterium]